LADCSKSGDIILVIKQQSYSKISKSYFFQELIMNGNMNKWTEFSNEELQTVFKSNMEKFNTRYQKIYEETIEAITPKTMSANL